jgi:hypothetical protein
MQIIGDALNADIAVYGQMRDRDQHRILNTDKPDYLGMTCADLLMPRQEAEQSCTR